MQTLVEFRSDRFPPYEGEEEKINPGLYGKRLAEFVQQGLRERGFDAAAPIAEDWGWVVPIMNERFRLWIGCGHYEEYADGFICHIEPHTPTIRRLFRRIDVSDRIAAVRTALDEMFCAEVGIRDKRWWTEEEFRQPRSCL